MKFFMDSANLDEIKEGVAAGLVDGITTNPSLVAKEGKTFRAVVDEILAVVDGPVSLEVVSVEAEAIVKEGRELAKIHKNVVVKVPMIPEGLKAIRRLSGEGIKVNTTLIFSPTQALLAAKAGASYVSPFIGRLDDISQQGMDIIEDIRQIFDNYDYETEILVASVRHPVHILDAARIGADVATMPFKVMMQLAQHPLTDIGLEKFLSDWKKVPKGG
jgi:transaldolase